MIETRRLAVLGDLHYETDHLAQYDRAREQLVAQRPDTVIQLGDQGGYSHCGSRLSFEEGRDFLAGFDRPFHTLIGNHDLEGCDFKTDADNIAAWCDIFGRERSYGAVDLGPALGLFLSSSRFRGNPHCCHEIYIDPEQIEWFRETLERNRDRPTFVFSHAPPLGSGLRVLQNIHLKCPNAWLNHTEQPQRFIEIVRENPQIKLWFSAHNHLGQVYDDSITTVGSTAFVHTGVIGHVSRDALRHSRLIDYNDAGLEVLTFDHDSGATTANWRVDYATGQATRLFEPHVPAEPAYFPPPAYPSEDNPLQIGNSVFAIHRDMLIEYDRTLAAPVGVVIDGLANRTVEVVRGELRLIDNTGGVTVLRPNRQGRYMQVFVPNERFHASRLGA